MPRLLLLGIATFGHYPVERPLLAATLLNPVDLSRVVLLLWCAGPLALGTGTFSRKDF